MMMMLVVKRQDDGEGKWKKSEVLCSDRER